MDQENSHTTQKKDISKSLDLDLRAHGNTILTIYLLILIKYIWISDSYFDVQFVMSTLFMIIINWIKINGDRLTDEIKDVGKFLGHIMFISVCFSIICGVVSFIYSILFYFGFSNTVIFFKIICVFLMSGLLPMYTKQLNEKLSKSNIGTKILQCINYYYNTYVVSKKIYERVINYGKHLLKNYVWVYCKIFFNKFMKINAELSDNKQSLIVKSKLNDKYTDAKNYINDQVIQPIVVNSVQNILNTDHFAGMNLNFSLEQSPKQYKSVSSNRSMNMSSLVNKKTIDNDNLDDLDEDVDLSNVPEVSEEQIEKAENLDRFLTAQQIDTPKIKTSEDNRATLKKKMAEKKAMRTLGNKQALKNNISNMMNMPAMKDFLDMPGMKEMMSSLTEGNNIDKILKQAPNDKSPQSLIEGDHIKKLLQEFSKKN